MFPKAENKSFTFTQRIRLGLNLKALQFGAGFDLIQSGRDNFINTENIGGFLRYEFK